MLALAAWPRLHAGGESVGTFCLVVQVVRWPLDEHTPPFATGMAEIVNFEGDPVFGTFDPGSEIIYREVFRGRAEKDRPIVKLIVHGQHGEIICAAICDPSNTTGLDQAHALCLVEMFEHGICRHLVMN
jgi:hypothetical protein